MGRPLPLIEELAVEEKERRPSAVVAPKAKAQAKVSPGVDIASEVANIVGTGETKANLCTCPELTGWIADQPDTEAALARDRRKACVQQASRAG